MTRADGQAVPRAGPVALRARGWGWRHATRRAWAVRGLDLDVAAGERVLLLGASGSGKSTLLAALAGLLDPGGPVGVRGAHREGIGDEEGSLLLDGVPARQARVSAVRSGSARTGLLLQDPQAQTVLARCGDDVAFGLENHAVPPEQIWPRVDEALRAVRFPYGRDHPTARLSGGERQRLALAGVLALRPGLLLLDEPTAMLDPDGARAVRDEVGRALAASGSTCVLVEHRVAEWLPVVDRVVVIAPGAGVVADGSPEDVLVRHGPGLAAEGVWVPGLTGQVPDRRTGPPAPPSPAGEGALLSARDLAAGVPGRPVPAVTGVDLDLCAGRLTCVVGPNGSGKSTLALTMAGLVPPLAGTVAATPPLAAGLDPWPWRWSPRDLVSRIGAVFQDPRHQFLAATVADELDVGPRRAGHSDPGIARRRADLLERLRLAHLERAHPFTLSGGEQRRLSVATALATRPAVLVLDEPTFGQDARTWAELVDLLTGVAADGSAVMACTHDAALVAAVDRSGAGAPVLALPRTPVRVRA